MYHVFIYNIKIPDKSGKFILCFKETPLNLLTCVDNSTDTIAL